ncbi:MAG TPA: hypothetical protein VGR80_07135, partial [Steroidobacteraceae bacterium]|nr:hypothetical protein [Steroidobacteraceae bacterium]
TYPFYLVRLMGGALFFSGMWIMAYNVWMTIRGVTPQAVPVPPPAPEHAPTPVPALAASGVRS